jgi:hypothetical protein
VTVWRTSQALRDEPAVHTASESNAEAFAIADSPWDLDGRQVSTDPASQTRGAAGLSGWALAAAVVVLILFGGFVGFLLSELNASEVRWSRLTWLFASVEAIAFGAAGALFGSSIQRSRAENAEAQAREHVEDAAKGRALAATVIADANGDQNGSGLESLGPEQEATSARKHAEIARALFPDLQ